MCADSRDYWRVIRCYLYIEVYIEVVMGQTYKYKEVY
jgi:hypothetical protein